MLAHLVFERDLSLVSPPTLVALLSLIFGSSRHFSIQSSRYPANGVKMSRGFGNISVFVIAVSLCGCAWRGSQTSPIEFRKVPLADAGGPTKFGVIEGRVADARSSRQIVLYARSGQWFVQPYVDQPFTSIDGSNWKNRIHLGTEYAALLVEPGYQPTAQLDTLPPPGGAVVAVALTPGRLLFWQTATFRLSCVLAVSLAVLLYFRWRMHQLSRELQLRFEERLVERTSIAQEIHDTLLQGVLSASMQLDVALDRLDDHSPAKPPLSRVLQLLRHVVEEGRHTLQGLRSPDGKPYSLEHALVGIPSELGAGHKAAFRVIVAGLQRRMRPLIRDEVYRIGREGLVNAFRHARAANIEVELDYAAHSFRLSVRDDGSGIEPQVLQSGRDGHRGLHGIRERAEEIGGRLRVWSRPSGGTEVELTVPGHLAFESQPAVRPRWLPIFQTRRMAAAEAESTAAAESVSERK